MTNFIDDEKGIFLHHQYPKGKMNVFTSTKSEMKNQCFHIINIQQEKRFFEKHDVFLNSEMKNIFLKIMHDLSLKSEMKKDFRKMRVSCLNLLLLKCTTKILNCEREYPSVALIKIFHNVLSHRNLSFVLAYSNPQGF